MAYKMSKRYSVSFHVFSSVCCVTVSTAAAILSFSSLGDITEVPYTIPLNVSLQDKKSSKSKEHDGHRISPSYPTQHLGKCKPSNFWTIWAKCGGAPSWDWSTGYWMCAGQSKWEREHPGCQRNDACYELGKGELVKTFRLCNNLKQTEILHKQHTEDRHKRWEHLRQQTR